jgi:FAD:protein FMN transferase
MHWSSTTSPDWVVSRLQPLLGTFVEIRAAGASSTITSFAVSRAFAAIAQAQRLMSPHLPDSDIGRLNLAPMGASLRVHPWTWRVLQLADELNKRSNGVFDVTVSCNPGIGSWRQIAFAARRSVRRTGPVSVDLGGIAKGFAVDRAIATLRRHGVPTAIVNAGGDIRVSGRYTHRVEVRHPARPESTVPLLALNNGAVCTSANYFDPHGKGRLRRPDGHEVYALRHSVSVCAPSCVIADALTKIVAAVRPEDCSPLLAHYRASALVVSRSGQITVSGKESSRHAA